MKKNAKTQKQGISANAIMMPLGIILAVLLVFIIILVFEVNRSSNELTDLMERFGVCQQETTNLQAGINTLTETANSFVQNPVSEDGEINVGPVMAFAQELERDRRGPQVAERFQDYDVSEEALEYIDHAAETSETMLETLTHVIALARSVYTLPPIPELSAIPEVELTKEELAMSDDERMGYARKLLQSQEYAQLRYSINEDTGSCTGILQQEFSTAVTRTRQHVATLRTVLWIVIFCIAVLLLFAYILLRAWVVWPLRRHAEEISHDENMTLLSGIREMRVLVIAYNALLKRRNKLEAILRSAAETDALTGLPNRYSLERYALETGDDSRPMAVLMFDVNFLKQVNDTKGHVAGDNLLRTAGKCILECFGSEGRDNCYRLGGDEFAAVLRGCSEEDVRDRIDRFELALERENISVSVGYAFTREANEDSIRELLREADKRMYKDKKHIHETVHDSEAL